MSPASPETCPLPDNPVLAETAQALNQAGLWAYVLDREHRVVYMTDELRRSNGGLVEMVRVPLGAHLFGADFLDAARFPPHHLHLARRAGDDDREGPSRRPDDPGLRAPHSGIRSASA